MFGLLFGLGTHVQQVANHGDVFARATYAQRIRLSIKKIGRFLDRSCFAQDAFRGRVRHSLDHPHRRPSAHARQPRPVPPGFHQLSRIADLITRPARRHGGLASMIRSGYPRNCTFQRATERTLHQFAQTFKQKKPDRAVHLSGHWDDLAPDARPSPGLNLAKSSADCID